MKRVLLMVGLVVAGIAVAQAQSAAEKLAADKTQISLADARGKIDKAIESPAVMKEIMKRLSAADQVKFLADVNKAIGDMPASPEEKSAKFLNINHAALTAAQKGNTTALLAEVFATVSPDALPVISERFAVDLVNRAANPNVTYTDEQFAKLATEVMNKISERTEETDNGSVRNTFAIVMFGRASNLTGDSLDKFQDALVDNALKHDDAKELAREEWIPAATGKDGREQSYESLLASADAGRRPDFAQVLNIAGPQHLDSVLADIGGKYTDPVSLVGATTPILDAVDNTLNKQPTMSNDAPGVGGEAGNAAAGGNQEVDPGTGESPRPTPENPDPKPYPGQTP